MCISWLLLIMLLSMHGSTMKNTEFLVVIDEFYSSLLFIYHKRMLHVIKSELPLG